MKKEQFLKKVRKFTDNEFLNLYKKGFSDRKISLFLGVNDIFRKGAR